MDSHEAYVNKASEINRNLIRLFSVCLIINMIYTSIIRFVYIGYFSWYYSMVTFGVLIPITVGAVIFGNLKDKAGLQYIAKQMFLASNSVLFAFMLQLRSLCCYLGVNAQCLISQRPLAEGLYAYTLAGPILTLFIYTNSLYYEGVFMLALYIFLLLTDIWIYSDTAHLLTIILVGGFYIITLYISKRYRQIDRVQGLLKRQKEIEDSSRAFVSYMLHELRNPLNNATLLLSMDEIAPSDRKHIIKELEGVKIIMDDALSYSNLSDGTFITEEKEDTLSSIWKQVSTMFEETLSTNGVTLNCQYLVESIHTVIIPTGDQLKQILIILLRYSISHSKRGDEVKLEFSFDNVLKVHLVDQASRDIKVGNRNLSIQYHTYDSIRGQELSLNLALKLLETIGCQVVINNDDTNFDITFTCFAKLDTSTEDEFPREIRLPTNSSDNRSALHILITDDNQITCKLLAKILHQLEHTSDIAVDGIDCIEKISVHHFDLMLLDSMMPRLDGPGVLMYVKENHIDIPVICVTANSLSSDLVKLYDLGAKMVLSKPVNISTLKDAINHVFNEC